jgi:hypothetical protein
MFSYTRGRVLYAAYIYVNSALAFSLAIRSNPDPIVPHSGGEGNTASGSHSTVGGGANNTVAAAGHRGTIGGGQGNTVSAAWAIIGGGDDKPNTWACRLD